jgi:hypothetical protein
MIEGNSSKSKWNRIMIEPFNAGVDFKNIFVSLNNIESLTDHFLFKDPDLFSLDIDGNDFFIAQYLFNHGFRPKICIVEYNATFGPEESISIPYRPDFSMYRAHSTHLYFGVSITAWRKLFEGHKYQYITVDLSGTNAIFVDRSHFNANFLENIKQVGFRDNIYQRLEFKMGWESRRLLLSNEAFQLVPD